MYSSSNTHSPSRSSNSASTPREPVTIDSLLADSTEQLTECLLAHTDIPAWDPPTAWNDLAARGADELQRIRSLAIPHVYGSTGDPDMLMYALGRMHDLDPEYPARLADLLSGDNHVYLCNASGTGKTRILFELLSQNWGIYLTCYFDNVSDPYGSSDVDHALYVLQREGINGRYLEDVIFSGPGSSHALTELEANRSSAAIALRWVMLARLIGLDHFVSLVDKLGISDLDARRKWLLVQLRPGDILYGDLFEQLVRHVSKLPSDDIAKRISTLYKKHHSKIAFVALDEAQVALNMSPRAFAFSDDQRHASLLRELIISIGNHFPRARIVASGTQLDMDQVEDALQSSRADCKHLRHFHSLGFFQTEARIKRYMAHFLGPSISQEHVTLARKWFRGRHRLLALLVTYTLLAGDSQIVAVLDTILHQLSGYARPEANILSDICLTTQFENARLEAFPFARLLRRAVLSFARQAQTSSFSTHCADFVQLGVAVFQGPDAAAEVFEPVVFLALYRWLQDSPGFSAFGIVRRSAADAATHLENADVLEAVAGCVLGATCVPGCTLRDYLRFSGVEPPWAQRSASLILPRLHDDVLEFIPHPVDNKTSLVVTATSSTDVFDWLSNAVSPFLIPDRQFGASMLCFLRLASGNDVAACFHILPAKRSRRDTSRRYVPCDPANFYHKTRSSATRLESILKSLPDLPLPVQRLSARRSRPQSKPARFSVLHILCFAEPYKAGPHDPPICSLALSPVLESALAEVRYSDIDRAA